MILAFSLCSLTLIVGGCGTGHGGASSPAPGTTGTASADGQAIATNIAMLTIFTATGPDGYTSAIVASPSPRKMAISSINADSLPPSSYSAGWWTLTASTVESGTTIIETAKAKFFGTDSVTEISSKGALVYGNIGKAAFDSFISISNTLEGRRYDLGTDSAPFYVSGILTATPEYSGPSVFTLTGAKDLSITLNYNQVAVAKPSYVPISGAINFNVTSSYYQFVTGTLNFNGTRETVVFSAPSYLAGVTYYINLISETVTTEPF